MASEPYPFHLPAIGFPCLFHLKPTILSRLLRRRNPKHSLRLAGQVFRLKPFQIKLAIRRTAICFHFSVCSEF
ncbi:hypothetical protein Hdeb2414_s0011g00372281 [Helianthus debilis subsp. tardiflorus]